MNHDARLKAFADHVLGDKPLQSLVMELRELRDAGISAQRVATMLNKLRSAYRDSPTEDRILEVLDYVTGFCSVEQTIWPEK